MKVESILLCNYAELTDDLLFNIYGGGIDNLRFTRLPESQHMGLAIAFDYIPSQDSGNHILEARIIDDKGVNKMNPQVEKVCLPDDMRGYYQIFDVWARFTKYGKHRVGIRVDGRVISSLPLQILPGEESDKKEPDINLPDGDIKGHNIPCSYCKKILRKTDATEIKLIHISKRSRNIVRVVQYYHPVHYNLMMKSICSDVKNKYVDALKYEAEKYKLFGTHISTNARNKMALGKLVFDELLRSFGIKLMDALYGEAFVRINIKPGKGYKLFNMLMKKLS